ncbi:MAG TPA: DUF881 domain-containing protein [Chloroflexota bacterium]|nr:DUF881 domain-containing protein [Chloroflexota bacterium]
MARQADERDAATPDFRIVRSLGAPGADRLLLQSKERRIPFKRIRSWLGTSRLGLFFVCLIFGFALMIQLRTQESLRQSTSGESANDLATIAGDLYDSNTLLRQEVDTLLSQQGNFTRSYDAGKQEDLAAEEARLEAFNGVVEVTGPGVELTIDAALRPVDVEDLLNEVRNAGAEAIAISGQRVVYNTAIGGKTGQVTVNGVKITSPVVFDAIGAPDVLEPALARKGGMLSYLRTSYPQAQITLTRQNNLDLPAYPNQIPIHPAS